MEDLEDLLVGHDLLGEELVLLGELEVVAASVSTSVKSSPDRNVSSIDVRSVSYASRMREARRAMRALEVGLLGRLLGFDLDELRVKSGGRGVELVDRVLAAGDVHDHRHDLGLDRQEVGVDLAQRALRPGDLAGQLAWFAVSVRIDAFCLAISCSSAAACRMRRSARRPTRAAASRT